MSFSRMEPKLLKGQCFLTLIFIVQYNETKVFQEVSCFLCFSCSVEWQQVFFCIFGMLRKFSNIKIEPIFASRNVFSFYVVVI